MATTAIKKKLDAGSYQLKDQVVAINRVTKVVKGGKNMSFAALVVVGDPTAGVVGFGSGMVLLKPAPEGTGVIAGGAVRAVMTSVGVQNVLTKSIGTANPHNVIKATFDALQKLRDRQEVASMRGKTAQEL